MTRAACLLLALTLLSGQDASVVTFHHLHYRVGDPSAAMSAVVLPLQGVRVIVPGLGVGVRAGNEYLLFDRADGDVPEGVGAADAYAAAVTWLTRFGVTAEPGDSSRTRVLGALPGERVDHVAFATRDLASIVSRLGAAGVMPVRATDSSAVFDAGAGVGVEIVRDTSGPDVFWCPMHPDVRSPGAGKCPLCGMDLVPIPPPKVGEYRIDVAVEPGAKARGLKRMRFTVREPESNEIVRRFATVHEKPFHLFVISRDLEYFQHVHPEPDREGFALEQHVPPGEYMLFADFLPEGGTPQMVQKAVIAPGGTPPREPRVPADPPRRMIVDGLAVTLEVAAAAAGKELPMTFAVSDAVSGAAVTDLQPYLGAPAHMMIVRADLSDAVHAHPEEPSTGGPTVSFHPLIPAAGDYKLWIQFLRGGKVTTVPFWIRAAR